MARHLSGLVWPLLFLTHTAFGATMDKFNWQATECAPENYPMEIVKGDFLYADDDSLYVPDGKTLHHGWGWSVSSHVVGPDLKPLPNRLSITFFSYTENQFYRGMFGLPYETIHRLFNEGYYSPKLKKHITYNQIMAGLTPGGAVAVWLQGIDKTTEIFFGQAEKINGDWLWILDNPDISREKFIQTEIADSLSSDAIATLKKNGIPYGRWETYHQKRYQWQPAFNGFEVIDGLIKLIKYYNGEEGYIYTPVAAADTKMTRSVPKEIHFIWRYSKDQKRMYELYFDETEVFELFSKLGKGNKSLTLEMKMVDTEKGRQFGVLLRNDEQGIYFRKIKLEEYGA